MLLRTIAGISAVLAGILYFCLDTALWLLPVMFLAGFVLLQLNIRKNGVVMSSIFMKLGLLVPMLVSTSTPRTSFKLELASASTTSTGVLFAAHR